MTKTPEQIESEAVERFKAEWAAADAEGDDGNRVRRGLRAVGLLAPGDLTDETIERAARAATDALYAEWAAAGDPYDEDMREAVFEMQVKAQRAALAAARVAPVTPSESDWLLLLMPDSGAHRTREWRGRAVDADAAIERAMDENPGWSVHTFGPDVNAKPAPSPDREKLIAEALDEASVRVDADTYYGDETDAEAAAKAAGFNAAMSIIEPYVQKLAALAVPPVVNKADGETIVRDREGRFWTKPPQSDKWRCGYDSVKPFRTWDELARDRGPLEVFTSGEPPEELAHVLVERQREWLG